MSLRQDVVGVTYLGVERLSELDDVPPGQWVVRNENNGKPLQVDNRGYISKKPPLPLLLKWMGDVKQLEKSNEQQRKVIGALASFFGEHNLRILVLKGYGCSLNYPDLSKRHVGDIDIYVLGPDSNTRPHNEIWKESNQYIGNSGIIIKCDNPHHSTFTFGGMAVENHQTILDIFRRSSDCYFEDILESLVIEAEQAQIENNIILLPSTKFNAIHLLRHMATDFATASTDLRHILDWAFFVSKNNIDFRELYDIAHHTNMHLFLNAINTICVDYLNFPEERFPIERRDNKLCERVLADILAFDCNTDKADDRIDIKKLSLLKKFQYGMSKTCRLWRNRWKFQIVYNQSFLNILFHSTFHRIVN